MENGTGTQLGTKTTTNVRLAPRYKVFVHNDDKTPAMFVVGVLNKFFF